MAYVAGRRIGDVETEKIHEAQQAADCQGLGCRQRSQRCVDDHHRDQSDVIRRVGIVRLLEDEERGAADAEIAEQADVQGKTPASVEMVDEQ